MVPVRGVRARPRPAARDRRRDPARPRRPARAPRRGDDRASRAGATPTSGRRKRCWPRCGPPTLAAPAWSRSARASSSWPPPDCSTAGARPRTGATWNGCARSIRACAWSRTSSTSTTARSSPPPAAPPASTCACTSCGAITERRSRTRWRAGWWCRPSAKAASRSTCRVPVASALTGGLGRVLEWAQRRLRRRPLRRALGTPGRDVAADVRAPVPRRDGHDPASLAEPPARPGRAAASGDGVGIGRARWPTAWACGRRRRCACTSAAFCARRPRRIGGGSPGLAPEGRNKRSARTHLSTHWLL